MWNSLLAGARAGGPSKEQQLEEANKGLKEKIQGLEEKFQSLQQKCGRCFIKS